MGELSLLKRALVALAAMAAAVALGYAWVAITGRLPSWNAEQERLPQTDAEKINILRKLAGTSSVSESDKRASLDALSGAEETPAPSEEERLEILGSLRAQ